MTRQHGSSSKKRLKEEIAPQAEKNRPIPTPPQRANPWYAILLLAVLLAPFAVILAVPGGRILGHPECDNPKAYYYYACYAGHCWRDGHLPLWNPYIMLGLPFLGEGQGSVFHPLALLYAFFRAGVAINWLIAASFVLTGLFFYGYLRALGLGRAACWCGAVTWSFSSAMISRIYAGHLNILLTFVSIPLIMMLWERWRARGGVLHLAGIALAYGMMLLAYYPQMLYIFSLFSLAYVLIQSGLAVLDRPAAARGEARAIGALGGCVALGVGIGAIQLLPGLDFVSRSFRETATIQFCGMYSFPPENLLTLIAPRFFGSAYSMPPGLYWGRYEFWEMWMYLGILPLIMAVAGVYAAPSRRRAALLVCAAVFLVLGLGENTFFFQWIYRTIPLFDTFRGSSKNTLITLFCLVTLSAHGFEGMFAEKNATRRRRLGRIAAGAAAVLFLIAVVVWAVFLRHPHAPGSNWRRLVDWVWHFNNAAVLRTHVNTKALVHRAAGCAAHALTRTMILLALSAILIGLMRAPRWRRRLFPLAATLVMADLLGVFLPMLMTFRPPSQGLVLGAQAPHRRYPLRILAPHIRRPDFAMRAEYSSAFGYAGNTLKRYNDFMNRIHQTDPNMSRAESGYQKFTPYFKLLAFDAIAMAPNEIVPDRRPIGRVGGWPMIGLEGDRDTLPRAYLAAAPRYFSRREEALAYVMADSGAPAAANPAIERPGGGLDPRPLEPGETVRFVSYEPNRIELETNARHRRELVLSSMYEKNWTAQVNGRPAAIAPANYVFRAVRVPAGPSRIVFEYRPAAFYRGAAVSAVSLAALLLIALGAWVRSMPGVRRPQLGPAAAAVGDSPPRRRPAQKLSVRRDRPAPGIACCHEA